MAAMASDCSGQTTTRFLQCSSQQQALRAICAVSGSIVYISSHACASPLRPIDAALIFGEEGRNHREPRVRGSRGGSGHWPSGGGNFRGNHRSEPGDPRRVWVGDCDSSYPLGVTRLYVAMCFTIVVYDCALRLCVAIVLVAHTTIIVSATAFQPAS